MHEAQAGAGGRTQRLKAEMAEYFVDVAYLTLLLGVFALYKRLVLAGYQISYFSYGATIVTALVLGKILVLGRLAGLDRPLRHKPLIYPTIYKAFIFALLVGAFAVLEELIGSWLRGRTTTDALSTFTGRGGYELIGKCLITFFSLIPFFGLKEVGLALGKGRIHDLFFRTGHLR